MNISSLSRRAMLAVGGFAASLETSTGFALASQVFDPDVDSADNHGSGWNIFSGERTPYRQMGVLPGHVIWHFDAVKLHSVDEHDADYLERARAFSDIFDQSPELDDGPSFFERILQRRGSGS